MGEIINAIIGPIQAAVEKFGARTPVGSALRSAEWAKMPLAFRERAFWSAGVENVRAVQTMHNELLADLAMERDDTGRFRSRATFVAKVRSMVAGLRNEAGGLRADLGDRANAGAGAAPATGPRAGAAPATGPGRSLTDLASRARAGLIYDMAVRSSAGYARWQTDNDPDILDAFPAQELIRILPRLKERDWPAKWEDKGGVLLDGDRMAALKTDPIWTKISRFGTPWPPFDYGSGMGLRDLDREEAETLGLIQPGVRMVPVQQEQFNSELEASVADLSPEFKDTLKALFGSQIVFDGDRAKWQADPEAYERNRQQDDAEARGLYERLATIDSIGKLGSLPELVSTIRGTKPLFHQTFRSNAEAEHVRGLLRTAVPEIDSTIIRSGEQAFLAVWNPKFNAFTPDEVELALITGGGRELGYGTDRREPGNLTVTIYDPAKSAVTGFEVPKQFGRLFAKARELDYSRATGTPYRYRVEGP